MGRYLIIGIATKISADKERIEREARFKSWEDFKLKFEKDFNSSGLYQMEETDNQVVLRLKPEIAEKEWVDFIRSFYKIRYVIDYSPEQDEVLQAISQAYKLEDWLALAEENRYESYHFNRLYFYPMVSREEKYMTYVSMDMVVLSCDGKIIMECFYELFTFFTRLVREKMADYRMANSLFVYITD